MSYLLIYSTKHFVLYYEAIWLLRNQMCISEIKDTIKLRERDTAGTRQISAQFYLKPKSSKIIEVLTNTNNTRLPILLQLFKLKYILVSYTISNNEM